MKNFKKLSREELKNIFGGRACSLVVQQADGSYKTYSGTCRIKTLTAIGDGGEQINPTVSYCDTGNGQMHLLSSNGGLSNC